MHQDILGSKNMFYLLLKIIFIFAATFKLLELISVWLRCDKHKKFDLMQGTLTEGEGSVH
jgi:hypothetical protein